MLLVHRMMLSSASIGAMAQRNAVSFCEPGKSSMLMQCATLLSTKKCFKIEEEKLVECVRKYPCVWQASATKYKDVWARRMPGERLPFRYKPI